MAQSQTSFDITALLPNALPINTDPNTNITNTHQPDNDILTQFSPSSNALSSFSFSPDVLPNVNMPLPDSFDMSPRPLPINIGKMTMPIPNLAHMTALNASPPALQPNINLTYPPKPIISTEPSTQELHDVILLDCLLQEQVQKNEVIQHRLVNDQRTFQDIESKLNQKLQRQQKRYDRELDKYRHKVSEEQKDEILVLDKETLDDQIQKLVDLDKEIHKIKKEINKKKWWEDVNGK